MPKRKTITPPRLKVIEIPGAPYPISISQGYWNGEKSGFVTLDTETGKTQFKTGYVHLPPEDCDPKMFLKQKLPRVNRIPSLDGKWFENGCFGGQQRVVIVSGEYRVNNIDLHNDKVHIEYGISRGMSMKFKTPGAAKKYFNALQPKHLLTHEEMRKHFKSR